MSETEKYRKVLAPFCKGYGVDIGYGGDPILENSVTVDLPQPYTHLGEYPLHLGGDARDLYWFDDNVLDYVYSSHCLEDFLNTEDILKEWIRVVKPGGNVVLLLPDQKRYEEYCCRHGSEPNAAHKIKEFGLGYLKAILRQLHYVEIVFEKDVLDDYCFLLVVRKTIPTHKSKARKWIRKLGLEKKS